MKKSIFKKLGGLFLGLAMGLGVAVGVTAGNKASEVKAEDVKFTFVSQNNFLGWTTSPATATSYEADRGISFSKTAVTLSYTPNYSVSKVSIDTSINGSGGTITVGNCQAVNLSGKHQVSTFNVNYSAGETITISTTASSKSTYFKEIVLTKGGGTTNYTVSFDVQSHGSAPTSVTVASGGTVTRPSDPTADGFTFGGWYKETECNNEWNFTVDTVSANTTLYAKWTKNSSGSSNYQLATADDIAAGKSIFLGDSGLKDFALNTTASSGLNVGTTPAPFILESASYSSKSGFKLKNGSNYITNSSSTTVSLGTTGSVFVFTNDGTGLRLDNLSNSSRFLGFTNTSHTSIKAYASSNLSSYDKVYAIVEALATQYSVSNSLTGVSSNGKTGAGAASGSEDYKATLTPSTGYDGFVIDSITVGGDQISSGSTGYTVNGGELTIYKSALTGDVVITAHGTKSSYTVNASGTGVAFPNPLPQAEYGTAYSVTYSVDSVNGYENPVTVTTKVGGTEVNPTISGTTITIPAANVTGDIQISAIATLHTYTLTTSGLQHIIFEQEDGSSLNHGGSLSGTITADTGYTLEGATITVTMGEADITAEALDDDYICIFEVTGDIVISGTAEASSEPDVGISTEELVLDYNESKTILFTASNSQLVSAIATLKDGDDEIASFGSLNTTTGELEITGTAKGISVYIIKINYSYGESLTGHKNFEVCIEVDRLTSIVNKLTNVATNNNSESIEYGTNYSAVLTPGSNKFISAEKLTVFGDDQNITSDVVQFAEFGASATVTIEKATYDTITITAQSTTISAKSLTIDDTDVKKEYYIGEAFSLENLTITANMNDGTTRNPQNVANQVTTPDMNIAASDVNVQISYLSKSSSYKIDIYDITNFVIEGTATATEGDESFDLSDLTVYPVYNGSTGTTPLAEGTYTLSTTSTVDVSTKAITVNVSYKGSSSETILKDLNVQNVTANVRETPKEVTMMYTGGATTNLTENDNGAETLNLDPTKWSVVGAKGAAANNVGLGYSSKDGNDIRLYWHADGSNTLTLTSLDPITTISYLKINVRSNYSNIKVLVGNVVITPNETDGIYYLGEGVKEVVLTNGNTSNIQVRFTDCVIGYAVERVESADTFLNAVNSIPSPITETNVEGAIEAIESAKIEYSKLSDDLKAQSNVSSAYETLLSAETTSINVKNQKDANVVINLIANLPDPESISDYSHHDNIRSTRNAYESLNEDAKALVNNLQKLIACETADEENKPKVYHIDTSDGDTGHEANSGANTEITSNEKLYAAYSGFKDAGIQYVSSSYAYGTNGGSTPQALKLGSSSKSGSLTLKMPHKYEEITSVKVLVMGWISSGSVTETSLTINDQTQTIAEDTYTFSGLTPSNSLTISTPKRVNIYDIEITYQINQNIKSAYTFENSFIYSPAGEYPASTPTSIDTGACRGDEGYYAKAKAAYRELSSEGKQFFATDEDFVNARARFEAWALANGETIDWSTGAFSGSKINPILNLNDVDNSIWVISAVALVGLTAIGGYFFYRKRKEI